MAKKPRIVIIGAGMAGLTAANKLYTSASSQDLFELCIVEAGTRIGGRINTSEFGGDRIEMGATWIHGIGGSPVYEIARQTASLHSEQPWECMDGFSGQPKPVAEGGFELTPSIIEPVSSFFDSLMDYAQGKLTEGSSSRENFDFYNLATKAFKIRTRNGDSGKISVGSFLRQGLSCYWDCFKEQDELNGYGTWSRKLVEEAIFAMHENTQRTYTSAGDLFTLDFTAESEYQMFPDEEITIARGYTTVIEHLASVLPPGLIQLGREVAKIDWQPEGYQSKHLENGYASSAKPVKLHFCDGSTMLADHVIVTVSLGVLKAGIHQDSGMFNPPLPSFKTQAISRLGYGVVNKLFLQLSPSHDAKGENLSKFPFLHMAFHRQESELRNKKIPWWMRRTASLCPIYKKSRVLLAWFAGEEALELESLSDEEIINGVSTTISSFLSQPHKKSESNNSHELCNGNVNHVESEVKFNKVLKSKWGSDPLFRGSYSYVAVGSGGDDLDTMAEPLPKIGSFESSANIPPLQILFAGEATHRTHYSTTHGAYFSGLREANRLLQHYQSVGV
ncbi:Lysine-specific histone demethylase 1 [Melia azedarach]|uniref:Lysine-specific histone demethylase 1 n=1 Tax=Melia azedarach TaxID=155640 RepID=A0ACC1XBT2_MELAZ|nr:Lysine-specific histone demethylase 1 [Melia azedarach]